MKKKLTLIIFSIFQLTTLYSQNSEDEIMLLNKKHLPYLENNISMNIASSVLNNILDSSDFTNNTVISNKSKLYSLTLTNNSFEIITLVDSKNSDSIYADVINKGYNDINMLCKYLVGFYYGVILPNSAEVIRSSSVDLEYEHIYEYKGETSRNTYLFKNDILDRALVFQNGSIVPNVESTYKFREKKRYHYLSEFKSFNRNYNFLFNLFITYKDLDDILVPEKFIVEVTSGENHTKFIYEANTQRITE